MKARMKFQKYGAMKFIGHLDIMRYFQKLFRRAEIDNEYSKGFSPHQIMSFAAPLGVGLTSDGEYLDISLLSADAPEEMLTRMNAAATEGIKIIDFHPLFDPEENKKVITAMSLVAAADYLVSLKDGYEIGEIKTQEEFQSIFQKFLTQKEIIIDKKTKTSEMAVDIRPMITLSAFDEQQYEDELISLLQSSSDHVAVEEVMADTVVKKNRPESVADIYQNGIKVYLQVATGSASNLKPELVMEAFCDYYEFPFSKYAWQVHRLELYTRDNESRKLIPLDQLDR